MRRRQRRGSLAGLGPGLALALALALAGLGVGGLTAWLFTNDLQRARSHAAQGSVLVQTRCGPIEYQEAGTGVPLLAVHGSGGGHDQGMAFAGGLAAQGIRVIAMSRFGYLRTPMPADASATAQADAHVCLLDALGIARAAVMGGSAGAPSALQMAIRHPDRVSALVMRVPLAFKPPTQTDSAPPMPPWVQSTVNQLISSDLLFWAALHVARDDRYGTYASAQYTASQITGAKFIGFDQGGHTWVGHNDEVMDAIRSLVLNAGRP